ncbi:hypothetical protein CHCC20331_2559 [Bacillus paralicheniformis]|nr:hypothetical protein CHCC20348_0434 [Bacillus paralicheniformis]TWK87198.1 hypothetical protein CHCC20331_2559 [Bacillus paralicheniformis]
MTVKTPFIQNIRFIVEQEAGNVSGHLAGLIAQPNAIFLKKELNMKCTDS